MFVKLPLEDLNHDPFPPHPTSTYTCEVIITLRVRGDMSSTMLII